ncbi:MAG: hypothetical protein OEM49_05915 [Myxococcales bacterium]|nr:hypothetical protein [Myxococcales bacterium]MDH5566660.1 hypothetical protein [Myxococcales bacterium]
MASQQPAPPAQVQWLIWAALLVSLVVYGLLPIVIDLDLGAPSLPEPTVVFALTAIGVATAVGTLVARQILLVRPARRRELDLATSEGLARFFQASLIFWTCADSIGIYGLLLYFLFQKLAYLYAFLVAAAGLMLYHAPRIAALRPPDTAADLAREHVKIG